MYRYKNGAGRAAFVSLRMLLSAQSFSRGLFITCCGVSTWARHDYNFFHFSDQIILLTKIWQGNIIRHYLLRKPHALWVCFRLLSSTVQLKIVSYSFLLEPQTICKSPHLFQNSLSCTFSHGPCLVPPKCKLWHYAKRRFPVTSNLRICMEY